METFGSPLVQPLAAVLRAGRGRRPRRVAGALTAQLWLLAALTGCTAQPAPSAETPSGSAAPAAPTATADPGPRATIVTAGDGTRLLALSRPQSAGDGAQVDGELIVTEGGCVGLRQEEATYAVIWPHGTQLDGDSGIDVPGAGSFGFGAQVNGGGGYYDVDAVGEASLRSALESCGGGHFAQMWIMGDD